MALGSPAATAGDPPLPFPAHTILDDLRHPGTRYEASPGEMATGASVARAGDVNADGWPDLLIGAPGSPMHAGRAWLVLGGHGLPRRLLLDDLGSLGLQLSAGAQGANRFGAFVAGAGDVDADGAGDFLVGIPAPLPPLLPEGGVLLVFGSPRLPEGLDPLAGRAGLLLRTRSSGTLLGETGTGAGDLDGDGYGDLALGLPGAAGANGAAGAGVVIVLFGGPHLRNLAPGVADLDGPEALPSTRIVGTAPGGALGSALAALGDADGDGAEDLGLGAPGQGPGGSVFVLFGREGFAAPDLVALDPALGVELRSSISGARLGHAVAGGRDATGDRHPDLLAGAPEAPGGDGPPPGLAVLVPGGPALRSRAVHLLPGPPGEAVTLLRGGRGDQAGWAVDLVPDLSGDGLAEIIAGAPGKSAGLGAAYLLYGQAELPELVFLEDLSPDGPPLGAAFLQNSRLGRLGESVAGLPDRRGTGRGGLGLGVPGFRYGEGSRTGAVYEVLTPRDPLAPASLSCGLLPCARVQLTWQPRVFEHVRVYRDGLPLTGPLPGDLFLFVDPAPGPGRHEYFIEGNDNPDLRSNLCRVDVRPLGVGDLRCEQIPGTTSVLIRWQAGDCYEALEIEINGRLDQVLPGTAGQYRFEAGPGVFDIQVTPRPGGEPAACRVTVRDLLLPPIENFRCTPLSGRRVQLEWDGSYPSHLLFRDGLLLARLGETASYLDDGVPPGRLDYALVGLEEGVHPGPASHCNVLIEPPGDGIIEGRVVFDDLPETPILGGHVVTHALGGPGDPLRVQLDASGRFQIAVEPGVLYRVHYEGSVGRNGFLDANLRAASATVRSASAEAGAGDTVTLVVSLPVLALAPAPADLLRWQALETLLRSDSPLFAAVLPRGTARGAIAVRRAVDLVRTRLEEELGNAPARIDLVAFGFSGLQARLFLHTAGERLVRKLVLLGTPNLGIPRARSEAPADAGSHPPPGAPDALTDPRYSAALEQTPAFLEEFNRRVRALRGAEVHLVAGSGGDAALDGLFGCPEHDDRLCAESALGGIPGAVPHRVTEAHELLGRGSRSLDLLRRRIGLGMVGERAGPGPGGGDGPGGGAALGAGGGDKVLGEGGGAESSAFSLARVYSGLLEPGDAGLLPFLSDTSGSIIIILHSKLPGTAVFSVETPEGTVVDPATAPVLGVEYLSFTDGEGQAAQSYTFLSGEPGLYTARLENPEGALEPVEYTLEMYLEGGTQLALKLEPEDLDPPEQPLLEATLTLDGLPVAGARVTARILRPDGSLELTGLSDDGLGADEAPGDGRYTAEAPASDLPGLHVVEVTATDGPPATFERTASAEFLVRSDLALLGGDWSSGLADTDGDGAAESLWVRGTVESRGAGAFLVTARLGDLAGGAISEAGAVFSLPGAQTAELQLAFDGLDIVASGTDGPYVLAEVELLDATVGFVRADRKMDAHFTDAYSWRDFVPPEGLRYVRGDSNADGKIDISDAVSTLIYLFFGRTTLPCRDAADTNNDGLVNLSDAVYLLQSLFRGGGPLELPYPVCGRAFRLGCASYPPCQ